MIKLKSNLSVYLFTLSSALVTMLFSAKFSGAEMQSPNFQIKQDVVGSFGAESASPNFQITDTGGEAGAKGASGSGESLWGGFWNNIFEAIDPGNNTDTDGDGIADGADNCPRKSNPGQSDSDGDGVGDACDNCEDDSNPSQRDADNDGVGNSCDNCRDDDNEAQKDSDNDDIGNACDNCPDKSNNSQKDTDDDGVGDSCDNCAAVSNYDQADSDNDGAGDACELPVSTGGATSGNSTGTTTNTNTDTDSDQKLNDVDNCLTVYNPLQEDADTDNIGDACDPDIDEDGIPNSSDNCHLISNYSQADGDNDGKGDVCDLIKDESESALPVKKGSGSWDDQAGKNEAEIPKSGIVQFVDLVREKAAENRKATISVIVFMVLIFVLMVIIAAGRIFGFLLRHRAS